MAAHAVTGLIQAISASHGLRYNPPKELVGKFLASIDAALSFSCWTEDIGEHFYTLFDAHEKKDIEGIYNALVEALPFAVSEWLKYDRPMMREEWMANKWPDLYEYNDKMGLSKKEEEDVPR